MADEPVQYGRRSDDPDVAVVIERLDSVDHQLEQIFTQTKDTNSRVSKLEVREEIRKDREEQKAIRDAAAEATKFKMEEHLEQKRQRRTILVSATMGATPVLIIELLRLAITHHA